MTTTTKKLLVVIVLPPFFGEGQLVTLLILYQNLSKKSILKDIKQALKVYFQGLPLWKIFKN